MNIKLLVLFLISLVGTCCAGEKSFCVCGPANARGIAKDVQNKEACEEQVAAKQCIWEKVRVSMLFASRGDYM